MKHVAFYTLGCKVNSYETGAMAAAFVARGYSVVDFSESADIYIINTCTVTSTGDKKSRQIVRRARRNNPTALVAVVGCYSQVDPEAARAIPGVDIVAGTSARANIVDIIEDHIPAHNIISTKYEPFEGSHSDRTRAIIKIQDGCDSFCSYCIIPYARGRSRSRDSKSILDEINLIANSGFREVVLVGIHLASFKPSLISLLEEIHKIDGIERIRLGSLSQSLITEAFADALLNLPKVCPHFHVSLQSGCNKTLAAMNRKYTIEEYIESINFLRRIPDAAITTDIIAGFPGETDADFEESLYHVEKCAFADIHVFPFSRRKGTRAYEMSHQIPSTVREERAAKLIELGQNMRTKFLTNYLGKTVSVLFEDGEGLSPNYIRIKSAGTGIQNVKISEICGDYCKGKPV